MILDIIEKFYLAEQELKASDDYLNDICKQSNLEGLINVVLKWNYNLKLDKGKASLYILRKVEK
jgi:hypothetical protein